jgi:hypothetical protein
LVLLDRDFTLRARLGVELEPHLSVVLSLRGAIRPDSEILAIQRSVGVFEAAEAPVIVTLTTNDVGLLH